MRGRKKKPLEKCPIAGCWEKTPGGRLCLACQSWWRRVQLYTPADLGGYLRRLDRFAGRSHRLHHTTVFRKRA